MTASAALRAAPASTARREPARDSGTLLSYWLDVVRAGRGQRMEDVAAEIRVHWSTLMTTRQLRTKRPPRQHVREGLAVYLDVQPETIMLLWSVAVTHNSVADRRHIHSGVREDYSRLAQEIDAVRLRLGHTMADVGEICDLSGPTTIAIRRQGARMHLRTATELANYMGVTVDQVRDWAQQPPLLELSYPLTTFVGTLYHPPLPFEISGSCDRCPFAGPCAYDTSRERDGFAWCERLLPVDLDLEQVPVSRTSRRTQRDEEEDDEF